MFDLIGFWFAVSVQVFILAFPVLWVIALLVEQGEKLILQNDFDARRSIGAKILHVGGWEDTYSPGHKLPYSEALKDTYLLGYKLSFSAADVWTLATMLVGAVIHLLMFLVVHCKGISPAYWEIVAKVSGAVAPVFGWFAVIMGGFCLFVWLGRKIHSLKKRLSALENAK